MDEVPLGLRIQWNGCNTSIVVAMKSVVRAEPATLKSDAAVTIRRFTSTREKYHSVETANTKAGKRRRRTTKCEIGV